MENILEKVKKERKVGVNLQHLLNKEEIEKFYSFVYEEHKNGMSILDIGRKYNIGNNTITKQFGKRNYVITNYQNELGIRTDLFENISTEEDAYWLGFIYADGYISDGGKVEVSLQSADYNHLLKLAKFIKFTKEVKLKDHRCRLAFATQELQQRFNDLGIVPRKSLILTFPNFLQKELIRHFIRWYFDGDGTIGVYDKKRNRRPVVTFSVLGTKQFLEEFQKHIPITIPQLRTKDNIHVFACSDKKARIMSNWLYSDCTIYLDRKYEKYQKIAVLWGNS